MATPDETRHRERFRAALLRNANREEIIALLACRPGMNLRQLARALGLTITAVQFHVGRMEDHGLITTRRGERGRETLCFLAEDAELWDQKATRGLFGRGPARELAFYLTENPMASVAQAAEALGAPVHTVRRHMRLLESNDLVHRLRVDREVLYHAGPVLEEWVEELQNRRRRPPRA